MSSFWLDFFQSRGTKIQVPRDRTPNDQGWINFPCVLHTHPTIDTGEHGSINVRWGAYRCWNADCRRAYNALLNRPTELATLAPWEWLVLQEGLPQREAIQIVEHRRLISMEEGVEELQHDDEGFTKIYAPLPQTIVEQMSEWQSNLSESLPIVHEYMRSRGLAFETLKRIGAGVVKGDDPSGVEDELVLPYTVNGQLVGIRRRLYNNTKRMVKNSYTTLFNLDALLTTNSRTAVIVEGETDTLYMQQAFWQRGQDIPVFGIPGVHFAHEWARHLQKFQRVIAIPQTDRAALTFVRELEGAFKDRLEVVTLPWDGFMLGKDIVDFCSYKPVETVINLLGLTSEDLEPLPRILTHKELIDASEKDVPWLIPELIERGTKTLLVGAPKTYKTWLALQLANTVINCEPFLGIPMWTPENPGKVLIVEEEGSLFRLGQRVALVFGSSELDGLHVIHRQGVRLDDVDSFRQLRQDVLSIRPDLVIFDPYASLHLQDENTVEGTMRVVGAFDTILRVLPSCAIVIIHHTPKASTGARGSGALLGAVDLQIEVLAKDAKDPRTGEKLRTVEFNLLGRDLREDQLPTLKFKFDPESGRHKKLDFVVVRTGSERTKQETVLSALRREPGRIFSIPETAAESGVEWSTVRDALVRLERQGLVVKVEVQGSRRNHYQYNGPEEIEDDGEDCET